MNQGPVESMISLSEKGSHSIPSIFIKTTQNILGPVKGQGISTQVGSVNIRVRSRFLVQIWDFKTK